MKTKIIRIGSEENYDPNILLPAAECLRNGGLIGIPTETVYGIAANSEIPEAISKLLEIRNSQREKYLTIHIHNIDALIKYIKEPITGKIKKIMDKFWPGPLTIVFPTPDGKGTGIRYPNNRIACDLIRLSGATVVVPSANLSGKPPAMSGKDVLTLFDGKIDFVIDGGVTRYQASSTVIRLKKPHIEVLREGAIPRNLLEEFTKITILFICTGNTCRSPIAEGICKKMLAQKYGIGESEIDGHFIVHSAGTGAGQDVMPSPELANVAEEFGISIRDHRSKPVTLSMIESADYIYVMSKSHADTLKEWSPESADKIFLIDPDGVEVTDPLGGTREDYIECINHIKKALEKRITQF